MFALLACTLIAAIQQTADTEFSYYYNLPVHGTLKKQSLFGFFGDANTGAALSAFPNGKPEKREILAIASNQCEAHCRHRISGEVLWYFFGPERVEWTRFGDVGGTTRPMPALLEKYQRLRGRKFGPGAWKDPAPGLAIDFLPVGYDASRVFFFVIKTKKIESWETEWAVQRWKNENGASVSGWKAVADERNPETIDSAFAEDFYVLKRQSEYFFVTQSGKLFVAPPRKKGEKSRAMKALWDDAKRPIVAVIEDADRGKVWLFAKDKTAGAKRDLFFEMNDTIKTESFDPAKLTPVNVEGRAKLLLEYLPLLPHANKK